MGGGGFQLQVVMFVFEVLSLLEVGSLVEYLGFLYQSFVASIGKNHLLCVL